MIESIKQSGGFSDVTPCFNVKLSETVNDEFMDFLEDFFDNKEIDMTASAYDGLDKPLTISLQGENLTVELIKISFSEAKMNFEKRESLKKTSNNDLVNRVWSENKGY